MSDTEAKKKISKGQRFLRIIGRDFTSMEVNKTRKASKARQEDALEALSPWCGRQAGGPKAQDALDWLTDEYEAFKAITGSARMAHDDDDDQLSASLLEIARTDALQFDAARDARLGAKAALARVVNLLKKIEPKAGPTFVAGSAEAIQFGRELSRGDPGEGVMDRVVMLEERLKQAAAAPTSKLELRRIELVSKMNALINVEDVKLGQLAYNTLPKNKVVFVEAEIRARLELQVIPLRAMLLRQSDDDASAEEKNIGSLEERFATAGAGLIAASKELSDMITADHGTSFLNEIIASQAAERQSVANEAARDEFLKSFAAVDAALASLSDRGPQTTDLDAQAADLVALAASDKRTILNESLFMHGPTVVASLLRKIAEVNALAMANVAPDAAALGKELAELSVVLSARGKAAASRVLPAYRSLLGELDQLRVVAGAGHSGAIAAARQQMAAIRSAGLDDKVATLEQRAIAIDAVTGDKRVKAEFRSEASDLLLAARAVMEKLDLLDLAASSDALALLERKAEGLKTRTDAYDAWRAITRERLAALRGKITDLRKLVPAGRETTFEQGVVEVAKTLDQPEPDKDAIDLVLSDAERVLYPMLLLLAVPGPDQAKAINALEEDVTRATKTREAAQALQEAASDRHAALEDDLRAFQTLLGETAKRVAASPDGNVHELNELKELGDQAKGRFKSGDEEGARRQTDSILKRLKALSQAPGGFTAARLEQLGHVDALWENVMANMREGLDIIIAKATLVAPEANVDPAVVKQSIDPARGYFDRFHAPLVHNVKLTIDRDQTIAVRKAAREDVLGNIRAIQALLDDNAVVASLSANPFGVKSPFKALRQFLMDVEYNASRAVPAQ